MCTLLQIKRFSYNLNLLYLTQKKKIMNTESIQQMLKRNSTDNFHLKN